MLEALEKPVLDYEEASAKDSIDHEGVNPLSTAGKNPTGDV